MATQYVHRILLIVPIAKVAAVVAWIRANVDPTCPDDLGPPLCAAGDATQMVTYRWQSGQWTDPEAKAILAKLCQLASITPPTNPQWTSWTGAQKRAWLVSVRAAILSGYGAYVQLSDGSGVWDDPATALAALGLTAAG